MTLTISCRRKSGRALCPGPVGIARLGEEPAQRVFSPFGDNRRIEIDLPEVEVINEE
jgi:hypothetical protein